LIRAGMVKFYEDLCRRYPIVSIEDGMAEDDWAGWNGLTDAIGAKVQLVGDDLFVTNPARLRRRDREKTGQRHPDQGQPDRHAHRDAGSDRDGAQGGLHGRRCRTARAKPRTPPSPTWRWPRTAGHIKTGSASRSDRLAKYNQLLRIEEQLGSSAKFAGAEFR
jgi:enolase